MISSKNTELKKILRRKRMTQTELSRKTGITYGIINNIVNGHTKAKLSYADKISKALDVDIKDIIKHDKEKRRKSESVKGKASPVYIKADIPSKYLENIIPASLFERDEASLFFRLIHNDIITFKDFYRKDLSRIRGFNKRSIDQINNKIKVYFNSK